MTYMEYSGKVITLVMAGCILAAGCTGYLPGKTPDLKNTPQTNSPVVSANGNDSSSLVRP